MKTSPPASPPDSGLLPTPGPPLPALFSPPGLELRRDLEALLPLIEKTFPVPARFRRTLASDAAELSRLLTSARGERPLSYLNRPPLLSAYLRYFLPWNLYRLCLLLPSLDLPLAPGDRILDLGAGPLTLPIALWLCRPEFRLLSLEFRCLDRSRPALEAGKTLFAALSAPSGSCPWIITTVCGELDRRREDAGRRVSPGPPAGPSKGPRRSPEDKDGFALVAALNVYNELFQPVSPGDNEGLSRLAKTQGALLAAHAGGAGRVLIVEPGVPRSGHFIALLREVLTGLGLPPLSPCPHAGPCPFPGPARGGPLKSAASGELPRGSPPSHRNLPENSPFSHRDSAGREEGRGAAKWCHFAFDTRDAPAALRRLSAVVGLPKERATLSFLLAGSPPHPLVSCPPVRIISGPFPLGLGGNREWGRYGCFDGGMALVRGGKALIESLPPGALVQVVFADQRDPKSRALLCRPAGG